MQGLRMSMRGRRAARAKRASAEIPRPGAMAPPRNSPRGEMASKVVAVPKSMTMMGGWKGGCWLPVAGWRRGRGFA